MKTRRGRAPGGLVALCLAGRNGEDLRTPGSIEHRLFGRYESPVAAGQPMPERPLRHASEVTGVGGVIDVQPRQLVVTNAPIEIFRSNGKRLRETRIAGVIGKP